MNRLHSAAQMLQHELDAQIAILKSEIELREKEMARLRQFRETLGSLPLFESHEDDVAGHTPVVREDRFGNLTMAQAAVEILSRSGRPMHSKDIWFELMRGGYPHHSPTSYQALVTCMNRLKKRFVRVNPNTFTLLAAESMDVPIEAVTEAKDGQTFNVFECAGPTT